MKHRPVYQGQAGLPYERRGTDIADQQQDTFIWFLKFTESAIYCFILFYFSGAVVGIIFPPVNDIDLAVENPLARLMWYPIYLAVLGLCVINIVHFVRISIFNPLLILCVLWCAISMVWSIDPPLTMRRSVALLMTTLAGLAIAARYDWDGFVQRLAFAFFLMAVVSLLIVVIKPSQGIMSEIYEGAWKGPFPEKNYLGGQMAKGFIACMCAFAMRPNRAWLWVPAGILCFFLVLMSTSKTALLISLFGLLAFLALRVYRRFPIMRILVLYFILVAITGFITLYLTIPDDLFGLIGKDATFTGRTDIWDQLIIAIKQNPIFGYGYGTFWEDPLGPSYDLRQALQWGVPTAHNGWFETWLSAGIVGVGLFLVLYIFTLGLAFDRVKRGGVETYWVVLSVLMFAMFSMSESTILQQNDLSWLIFVATSAKLFAMERPFWRARPRIPYVFSHREEFMPQTSPRG